jgi:hypothetical protein
MLTRVVTSLASATATAAAAALAPLAAIRAIGLGVDFLLAVDLVAADALVPLRPCAAVLDDFAVFAVD